MGRFLSVLLLGVLVLSACSTASGPSLAGTFAGDMYLGANHVGYMRLNISTTGTRLSGTGCVAIISGSEECYTLTGTLDSSTISFSVDSLHFSGPWSQSTLTTTFTASDTSISGRVTFHRYTSTTTALEVEQVDGSAHTLAELVKAVIRD